MFMDVVPRFSYTPCLAAVHLETVNCEAIRDRNLDLHLRYEGH